MKRRIVSSAPMATAFEGLPGEGLPGCCQLCQKSVSGRKRQYATSRIRRRADVLTFLNLIQVLLYVPLLALAGQGLLFVLAGAKRDSNIFYQLLQIISKPFTFVVRKITPAKVADRHVPIVTFCLLIVAYAVVTFERIDLCMRIGLEQCR